VDDLGKSNGAVTQKIAAGAVPLALVGVQETDDPCHWERVSEPWEVLATPVSAGRFHNRKTFLATPNCILYEESFASRLRVRALSPEGMLALSVPIRWGGGTRYFNRPLQERGLPLTLPGAAEAMLDAGQQHYMLLIRLTLLRSLLAESQWTALEVVAARRCLVAPAITRERLALWLGGLLNRAHQAPAMLNHLAAVQALEEELVQGLFEALRLPADQERPERASVRRRGFDRAVEHIRQAELTRLSLPSLSAAAGVSPRTLEYAFQEQLGLSPLGFVRMLRLHGLRRALLAGRLGVSTVTDVAHHLGFTQLGRLAQAYCQAFGEHPSATLSRPFRGDTTKFWIPAFSQARKVNGAQTRHPRD